MTKYHAARMTPYGWETHEFNSEDRARRWLEGWDVTRLYHGNIYTTDELIGLLKKKGLA